MQQKEKTIEVSEKGGPVYLKIMMDLSIIATFFLWPKPNIRILLVGTSGHPNQRKSVRKVLFIMKLFVFL